MNLPGIEPERPIGDSLDRCFTPDRLADAVVATVPLGPDYRVVEPSFGGGAFLRAIRRRYPTAYRFGVDVDPGAADVGRALCDAFTIGDWPEVAARLEWQPQLVVGNPPFGEALAHVEAALALGCVVSFILPLAYLGVQEWAPLLDRHPPAYVRPIRGRPWPLKVRETAVFEWWPRGVAACTQLVPLRGYPR